MIRVSKDQVEILSDLGYVFSIPKSEFIDDCEYEVPYLEDVRKWLFYKGIAININYYDSKIANANGETWRCDCAVIRKSDGQTVFYDGNIMIYEYALIVGVHEGLKLLRSQC